MTTDNQKMPTTVMLSDGRIEDVLWSSYPDFTLGPSPFRFGGWIAQLFLLACGIFLFVDTYSVWNEVIQNGIIWSLEGKLSTYQPLRMVLNPFGALLTLMAVFWKIPLRWLSSRTMYLITKSGAIILDAHTYRVRLELPFNRLKKPVRNGDFIEFQPTFPSRWTNIMRKFGPLSEPVTAHEAAIAGWSLQNLCKGIKS